MAREHRASAKPWGTLEDLLLACAVNRHGTKSWDAIAMELQNRSSNLPSFVLLTPQHCRDKFEALKRRFLPRNDDESLISVAIVDELRRIRVDELRREVQRRDVTIVSLELKVKTLEEERTRGSKEDSQAEPLDLKKDLGGETTPLPENLAAKSDSGDDSDDKENRSFNESNSTSQNQKAGAQERNGVVGEQERPEPPGNDPDPGRAGSEPGKDPSVNGKVEEGKTNTNTNTNTNTTTTTTTTNDAESKEKSGVKKASRASGLGDSGEGLESVYESKREIKEALSKQSSDVQSSASLSKKKRHRSSGSGRGGDGGSSSGEEPEGDEVSPATKRVLAVKSEPLVELLGIIRSHRLGSVFERRLRSQESERYKKLIRQHMDLQTVQSRLDRGVYFDCIHKFFRDLLLLFNNGVIFFRKNSPEHLAAQELRGVVWKEMNRKLRQPLPRTIKPEPKPEPESFSKANKSSTLVGCGKRNPVKPLPQGFNRKADKREREVEEKPKVYEKKNDASFVKVEEKGIRKQRTKERLGQRSSRSNTKGGEIKHEYGGNELSSHDALEVKMEKKENTVKKKQGAASFLKRMKQNSPSEVIENDDDDDDDSEDDKEEEEEKRKRGRKRDGRAERITRSSTSGRGGKEESGKVKRGVGRPPKRPDSVAAGTGKRGRDNGESEVVGTAGRPKKRSRR